MSSDIEVRIEMFEQFGRIVSTGKSASDVENLSREFLSDYDLSDSDNLLSLSEAILSTFSGAVDVLQSADFSSITDDVAKGAKLATRASSILNIVNTSTLIQSELRGKGKLSDGTVLNIASGIASAAAAGAAIGLMSPIGLAIAGIGVGITIWQMAFDGGKTTEISDFVIGIKNKTAEGADEFQKWSLDTSRQFNASAADGTNADDRLYGTTEADNLEGKSGADRLLGFEGVDILNGGEGDDILLGGIGGDTLEGGKNSDTLFGEEGEDTLKGGTGNDFLYGGSENDTLEGGDGEDVLHGGQGADTMRGGDDSDIYYVDNAGDTAEDTGGDKDVVKSTVDFTLGSGLENLELLESAKVGTGNEEDNEIIGNDNGNILSGGKGSDFIKGGALNDFIYGNVKNDASEEEGDKNILFGYGGVDTIHGGDQHDWIDGGDDPDFLYGGKGEDRIQGGRGNDVIYAQTRDDSSEKFANKLYGGKGMDTIYGAAGDDHLDGGDDNDHMEGEKGNDTYIVDSKDDVIIEKEEEGIDTVYSTSSYELSRHLEVLYLNGDQAINGKGNDLNNKIHGNDKSNIIEAGKGHDVIRSGAGDDTLDGGSGRNFLFGGAGFDTYILNEHDFIFDEDKRGELKLDGNILSGGEYRSGFHDYRDSYGNVYEYFFRGNSRDLIINGDHYIQSFKNGDFGIFLGRQEPVKSPKYNRNQGIVLV